MVAGWSLAGSPCARLPPTVARLRTSGSAITAAVSTRIGYLALHERRALERRLARQRADLEDAAFLLDVVEPGDAADVDEVPRPRQPELEQRQQALAAGEDLRLVAASFSSSPSASGQRLRGVVVERREESSITLRVSLRPAKKPVRIAPPPDAAADRSRSPACALYARLPAREASFRKKRPRWAARRDGRPWWCERGRGGPSVGGGDEARRRGRGRGRRTERVGFLQLGAHRLGEFLEHLSRHVLHQAAAELRQEAGDVDVGDHGHLGLAGRLLDEAALHLHVGAAASA